MASPQVKRKARGSAKRRPSGRAEQSTNGPTKRKASVRRIGIRDRLGQLTVAAACRLLEDGTKARLRRGGQFEIDLDQDVYLGGDMLRVSVRDPQLRDGQTATVT